MKLRQFAFDSWSFGDDGPDLWKLVRDGKGTVAIHAVLSAAVNYSPLDRNFNEEGQHIVLRNDPDEEFWECAGDQRHSTQYDSDVKVNHAKFGELLAESKAICGTKDED